MKKKKIGIDLGGTKIRAALVSKNGRVLHAATEPVPRSLDPDECVEAAYHAVLRAVGGARKMKTIDRIGLAAAGQIHQTTREIIHSPNLDWHNVPFSRMLSERTGLPVAIENDVNAAALGEYHFGAGRGCGHLVAVMIGTGIGGGFVLDGKLYTGCGGVAAEVGHQVYRENGPACSCGKRGCFEAYAGGGNLERRYNNALKRKGMKTGARVKDIVAAARAGNELAARYWSEAENALIALSANVVTLLNPEVLVIGGSIGLKVKGLVSRIRKGVEKYSTVGSWETVKVVRAELGTDAGVVGAGMLEP